MQRIVIGNGHLQACFALKGAELISLNDGRGKALLWHGDAAFWTGRSPLLFPIVGRLPHDIAVINGKSYPMSSHGFARTSEFVLVSYDDTSCHFELKSSAATLERYPFAFRLGVIYRIRGCTLDVIATVTNDSDQGMPMSFGYHPAFLWPLDVNIPRDAHIIEFETPEPAKIRRIADGLLTDAGHASPLEGTTLRLRDDLFADGAIIFETLASRQVTYSAPGGTAIRVSAPDLPHLGIWTKPGAPFVCIEPWQGHAAPADFTGELKDKPGMVSLDSGASRVFAMTVEVMTS